MSYYNQPDHPVLDRQLTRTPLFELSTGLVSISPTSLERGAQLETLKAACDSDLEKEWLDFLDERNLLLPDVAQKYIDGCDTRCDFYYSDRGVAIYIDGTPHDPADVVRQDEAITDCLVMDLGLTVLRFRHDKKSEWERICHNHAYVFGKVRA
jgi:very-short-patch-repair endonuclease